MPEEDNELAQQQKELARLLSQRDELVPSALPVISHQKVDPRTAWTAAAIASLGALLGSRRAGPALGSFLQRLQAGVDQENALKRETALRDWSAREAQRREKLSLLDSDVQRRSRDIDQIQSRAERRDQTLRQQKELDQRRMDIKEQEAREDRIRSEAISREEIRRKEDREYQAALRKEDQARQDALRKEERARQDQLLAEERVWRREQEAARRMERASDWDRRSFLQEDAQAARAEMEEARAQGRINQEIQKLLNSPPKSPSDRKLVMEWVAVERKIASERTKVLGGEESDYFTERVEYYVNPGGRQMAKPIAVVTKKGQALIDRSMQLRRLLRLGQRPQNSYGAFDPIQNSWATGVQIRPTKP